MMDATSSVILPPRVWGPNPSGSSRDSLLYSTLLTCVSACFGRLEYEAASTFGILFNFFDLGKIFANSSFVGSIIGCPCMLHTQFNPTIFKYKILYFK